MQRELNLRAMEEIQNSGSRGSAASAAPAALHEKAEQNLQYIRDLMESSSSFTGISGIGYMLAGLSAFAATWLAIQQQSAFSWLLVWMAELLVAGALAIGFTVSKARRQGESLWSTTGKKILSAFIPPMTVGAVLTLYFAQQNNIDILPRIWLCVYGAAVMTAGAYSVAAIPLMGALFLVLGTMVLFLNTPGPEMLQFGNLWLGASMGGLHLIIGYVIWKDYGG